ncbi:MAG TPA: cupin domain-containing protein [Chloroflexota bacterium]|jgi:mannose-6-phosphate isomerase-like protein (cupin superfamily)
MPVRVLPLDRDAFMGAAVGSLAPGTRFDVHFHHALEQLSFVIKGRVWVTMRAPGDAGPRTRVLGAGEAMTNPPGATLAFANEDDTVPAELLFVCAPPFPADGSEVVVTGQHREPTEAERAQAGARLAWALEHFQRVGESRLNSPT